MRDLSSAGKAQVATEVLILSDRKRPFRFSLHSQLSGDSLPVRLAEVHPEMTETLKIRLAGWVRRELGSLLEELENQMR